LKLFRRKVLQTELVFRVEHKLEGYGPYIHANGDAHGEVAGLHYAHGSSVAHPGPLSPKEELTQVLRIGHSFGFPSRAALDKWFAGFKRKLHAAGFVIRTYEAPSDTTYHSNSGKQVIFMRDLSDVVDTEPAVRYRS
jgi:hypothetical protein